MDLVFKFWDAWTKQVSETTKNVIDANASITKNMVYQAQKPYTWIKNTIQK